MNLEYKQALLDYKADLNGALARVAGNEAIYERLLLKFLSDPNFSNLKTCIITNHYDDAFQYAHTLKGLSGNLGLNPIFEAVHPMVELLRNNQTEDVPELLPALEHAYNDLGNIVREYQQKRL